jgi:hypothetical protein
MFGPVMTSIRRLASSRQSFGMNDWPRSCSLRFDDRVAAAFDLDARLAHELRPAPVRALGALGQRRQRVERRQGTRHRRERLDLRGERIEQGLVEELLARQRALAGRERLVLEGLELGRDEALGVLHRLPASVIGRHLARLALRDLDEEAVHPVELDAQVRDAAALPLARLELEQEGVAAAADGAQLVELGVVAGGDHAAVPQQGRRLLRQRRFQQGEDRIGRRQRLRAHREQERAIAGDGGTHLRQGLQRRAKPGELARPGLAQGDPGGDPLDVGEVAQRRAQRIEARLMQRGDRFVTLARDLALAPRLGQPEAQRPAAHAGGAAVEGREQRRRVLAAQVRVSSRLRWVVGGRSTSSLARCTVSRCTWASARPCVCSA